MTAVLEAPQKLIQPFPEQPRQRTPEPPVGGMNLGPFCSYLRGGEEDAWVEPAPAPGRSTREYVGGHRLSKTFVSGNLPPARGHAMVPAPMPPARPPAGNQRGWFDPITPYHGTPFYEQTQAPSTSKSIEDDPRYQDVAGISADADYPPWPITGTYMARSHRRPEDMPGSKDRLGWRARALGALSLTPGVLMIYEGIRNTPAWEHLGKLAAHFS